MLSYFVFRTLDSSVFDTKTCPCWDSWVLATTHPVFFPPPLWLSLRGVLGTHVDTPACMSRFWPHPKQSPRVLSQVSLGQVHTRANVCPREGRPDGQALEVDLGLCKQGISATWRIIWEVGGGPWALGLEKAQLEDRMRSGAGPSCWGSCMFPPLGTYGVLF